MLYRRIWIVFLFIIVFPAVSKAQIKPRIAVMPFEAGAGVSLSEAKYLTNRVRTHLINSGKFDVISNDQIKTMLKTKALKQKIGRGSCTSKECIIDLGNALECEKMIVGSAEGAFGEYTISVKLVDVVKQKYEMAKDISIKEKNKFPEAAKMVAAFISASSNKRINVQDEKLVKERAIARKKSLLAKRDFIRFGYGVKSGIADKEMDSFYSNDISLFFEINPFQISPEISFLVKGFYKKYSMGSLGGLTLDPLSTKSLSLGTLIQYGGDLGARVSFVRGLFLNQLWDIYITLGLRFSNVNEEADNGISNTFFSIGGIAGSGINISLFPGFGLFIEYNYGYMPVGSSKANMEGNQFYVGMTLRI